jgi:hypothetical protein
MAQKGNNYRHGYFGTPTYKTWSEMKYRCNKNINNYKNITYCKEWEKFETFLKDMGERPKGKTLDRINVYGNYEPSNCRWATLEEQENNKTNNKYYYIEEEYLTLPQIARKYKISRSNLANKVYLYKWDINKAINYLLERGDLYGTKKNV